jgi:ubiquinone/menaquinone biosynthesis C-methylase UbiE
MSETDRIARAYGDLDERAAARWDPRNSGNQRILAERRRLIKRVLERERWLPLRDRRVLDVGSGGGAELAWFLELGARESSLVGIDLLPARVEVARRSFPHLDFRVGNAEHLPFADGSFDLVVASTIFSSILDAEMSANVAAEIRRVLRRGGGLLWYDFRYNSPANPNVRGVSAARVRTLFPDLQGELIRLTLLPPLARRLGPLTPIAYPTLGLVPPLRSHLLGLLRKAS